MISAEEIWGDTTRLDPLAGYFKGMLQESGLVDIVPNEVVPTWRNGRSGRDEITKILDRVIMSEDMVTSVGRHRSWVDYPYISDHAPIFYRLTTYLILLLILSR
jgi:hypothetical protein